MAAGGSTGEMTGEELEAPGEGANGQQLGGETQLEGEGEIEAERKGNDDSEGELQAEDGEMKGDEGETKQQEFSAENPGEAESDEKGTDGEEGSDGGDGEDEDDDEEDDEEEEEEENEEPLSLEWPGTRQKQAIYLFLLPIAFPLWLTVPDVRRLVSWPSCIPGREAVGSLCTPTQVGVGVGVEFSALEGPMQPRAYRWAWEALACACFHHRKQREPVPLDSSRSILSLIWE